MKEQKELIYGEIYRSPVGPLTVLSGEKGVLAVKFGEDEYIKTRGQFNEISRWAVKELKEYFLGERKKFTVPWVAEGTEFQKRVWKILSRIPYGETRTYKEIAEEAGNSQASRAVGMANNKNPIPIIIPCHRVIGSDGKLTGYAGGLEIKKFLLDLERGNTKTWV